MYKYELSIEYENMEEYQGGILNVFDISGDYDEEKISRTRNELYKELIKVDEFYDLFSKATKGVLSEANEDYEWGMVILFQYDYFKKFHKCIQLFYNKDDSFKNEISVLISLL